LESDFWEITFQTFLYLFAIRKVGQQLKENLAWFSGKYFPFILSGRHFSEVVKNLEMSYYLLLYLSLLKNIKNILI